MVLLQDGCIAFFSAVGMTTVVWLVAGALLHAGRPPDPGLVLVQPRADQALAGEADVREGKRLCDRLPGARIVLADCGMSADARSLAEYMAGRTENITLAEGDRLAVE